MAEQMIDLKALLTLIDSQKNLNTNLCLDQGCLLPVEDPKPLVKVINYILNFLNEYSGERIDVSLSLSSERITMSFLCLGESREAQVPEQLVETLAQYGGSLSYQNEPMQFLIGFERNGE